MDTGHLEVEDGAYYEIVFHMEPRVPDEVMALSTVTRESMKKVGGKIPSETDSRIAAYVGEESQKYLLDLTVYQQ